jgi:hypothetical protein
VKKYKHESIVIETRVTLVLTRLGIENSLHMCNEVCGITKSAYNQL